MVPDSAQQSGVEKEVDKEKDGGTTNTEPQGLTDEAPSRAGKESSASQTVNIPLIIVIIVLAAVIIYGVLSRGTVKRVFVKIKDKIQRNSKGA